MKIILQKDGLGFLASVEGTENLFAYGETEATAQQELIHVLEMMMDYQQEQIGLEQKAREQILQGKIQYAV